MKLDKKVRLIILQILLAIFSFGYTIHSFIFLIYIDTNIIMSIWNQGFSYPREFFFIFLTFPSHLIILLLLLVKKINVKRLILYIAPPLLVGGMMLNWWQPIGILIMYTPFIITWILCLLQFRGKTNGDLNPSKKD